MRRETTLATDYGNGVATGCTPESGDSSRTFSIDLSLPDDQVTRDNAQGKTAEPTFTWEVRSS